MAWGSLGLDLVCTIVPGATGGGKAVKAIAKASEVGKVSDGAKAVYKAADKANLTVTQFVDSMNKAGYKIQSTI